MNHWKEITQYFLKLGFSGFGGPVALTSMMQTELIEQRQWISRQEFDQAFPLIKAMPGALAFQTAAYLGFKRGGAIGGLLAGAGLVVPAAIMMVILAVLAPELSQFSWLSSMMIGFQAGALAIIIISCLQLAKPYRKKTLWWIYVLVTIGLAYKKVPEPLIIVSLGLINIFVAKKIKVNSAQVHSIPIVELVVVCLLAGSVVFGTGLAALPWLENQIVVLHKWVSQGEFLQAVAFGQITPGPVLVTTTYIGYKISGWLGAVLATIAIFLPGYIHMTTWFPKMVDRLSKKIWIQDFSEGALGAVVGTLIFVVMRYVPNLGYKGAVIFAVAGFCLWRFKVPSWMLIVLSGVAGLFLMAF